MNSSSTDDFEGMLSRMYAAAVDPGCWPLMVEQAVHLVGAERALLFYSDWSNGWEALPQAVWNFDPETLALWHSRYQDPEDDLWTARLGLGPGGQVATGASVVNPAELRRTVIYNELLGPLGMNDVLSATTTKENGAHSVLAFYRREPFQRESVELVQRMLPHLQIVVPLQRQLSEILSRAHGGEATRPRRSVGFVTLDASGRLIHADRKAETILAEPDGLAIRRERLRCLHESERAALDAAVRSAGQAALGRGLARGQVLSISRPAPRRPLAVLIAPVVPLRRGVDLPIVAAGHRAAVVVTITDPDDAPAPAIDRLARLFHLTPDEAGLVAALAAGRSLDEYASRAAITVHAARSTLQLALAKTACRRQSELMQLVATTCGADREA